MKKIPCIFQRDFSIRNSKVDPRVTPGCEWVLAGEGMATRKWDGSACLIRNGRLFKRYDAKPNRTPPLGFEPCQDAPDPNSGHWPGWIPVSINEPADKWHLEALASYPNIPDGTYELIGPKIQGNPESVVCHMFMRHGEAIVGESYFERTFEGFKSFFAPPRKMEGLVFHHPDGRMAKIRMDDFYDSRVCK